MFSRLLAFCAALALGASTLSAQITSTTNRLKLDDGLGHELIIAPPTTGWPSTGTFTWTLPFPPSGIASGFVQAGSPGLTSLQWDDASKYWKAVAGGGLTGSGTLNVIPKWAAGGTSLTNSNISDNGTTVQITNAAILIDGTTGSTPTSGAGTRMMWIPQKAAFRAGKVSGTEWDDLSIGSRSVALGENTIASGTASIALGHTAYATGAAAISMGASTIASANFAFATGENSNASGAWSTAIGNGSIASGAASTSIGEGSTASAQWSTAIGKSNIAGGVGAIAMGGATQAAGLLSTSLGYLTEANGDYSTAMGNGTTASGSASTAMGATTSAGGNFSFAIGESTSATGAWSTAMGRTSSAAGNVALSVGENTSASANWSVALGNGTTASNIGATALGASTTASGSISTAMGYTSVASGNYSTAMNASIASGQLSTAMNTATASGTGATALGASEASGANAVSFGASNASGTNSFSSGVMTAASGSQSVVFGLQSSAAGDNSFAGGYGASTIGDNSFAFGLYSFADDEGSIVLADANDASSDLRSFGTNTFSVRASGGTRIYSDGALSTGVTLAAGANAWASVSDSNKKENRLNINGNDVLNKLSTIWLGSWNYKSQDKTTRHYGPMAQEFFAAFGKDGIGIIGNDTTLATADVDGVTLIAVKALEARTREMQNEMNDVRTENAMLRKQNAQLMTKLVTIERTLETINLPRVQTLTVSAK